MTEGSVFGLEYSDCSEVARQVQPLVRAMGPTRGSPAAAWGQAFGSEYFAVCSFFVLPRAMGRVEQADRTAKGIEKALRVGVPREVALHCCLARTEEAGRTHR